MDRHSGWVVAVPCLDKGLTGDKVAKAMLMHQWRPFGIPSLVTSDQGSHFVSAWWQSMCALLGIRQAYSQAYHHASNGRAEIAGQQVMEILRKLHVQVKIFWVEALPQVLDKIHDVRGETGYTPYEIVFGRQRPLAQVPASSPHECQDASEFFAHMKHIDERVSDMLNEHHAKLAARLNNTRADSSTFQLGDKVWYRRPENTGINWIPGGLDLP